MLLCRHSCENKGGGWNLQNLAFLCFRSEFYFLLIKIQNMIFFFFDNWHAWHHYFNNFVSKWITCHNLNHLLLYNERSRLRKLYSVEYLETLEDLDPDFCLVYSWKLTLLVLLSLPHAAVKYMKMIMLLMFVSCS